MTDLDRADIVRQTVAFVLGHYETRDGHSPFQPTEINPDDWWAKVQLTAANTDELLPRSRAHFDARLTRWTELAVAEFAGQ